MTQKSLKLQPLETSLRLSRTKMMVLPITQTSRNYFASPFIKVSDKHEIDNATKIYNLLISFETVAVVGCVNLTMSK